jgi:hypothetical protein
VALSGVGVAVPRANIVIEPTSRSLSFGEQAVGSESSPKVVFIRNDGLADMLLSNFVFVSAKPVFTDRTPLLADNPQGLPECELGSVVKPNERCVIGIVFAPADVGDATGILRFTHNGTPNGLSEVATILLSGKGTPRPEPRISVSEASLDFGEQVLGTEGSVKLVTIRNNGTADMTNIAVAVTGNAGTKANDFRTVNRCAASLIPNASCSIEVTFTPQLPPEDAPNLNVVGDKSAMLVISSNAANASDGKVDLRGKAIPVPVPIVKLSATTVGFGTQVVNGAEVTQKIILTNIGQRPLAISKITATGDYSQTNTCSTSVPLEPTKTCDISIRFAARSEGTAAGSVEIESNAKTSPDKIMLEGSGCVLIITGGSAGRRGFILPTRSCAVP